MKCEQTLVKIRRNCIDHESPLLELEREQNVHRQQLIECDKETLSVTSARFMSCVSVMLADVTANHTFSV